MSGAAATGSHRLDARAVARRACALAVYAVFAGGLIFAVEAFDRLVVLRRNFGGATDALALVLLTAAAIPLVAGAGAVFGVGWSLADALRRAVAQRLPERVERWRDLTALVASAAAVAVVLRIGSTFVPWLVETPVRRLLYRIETRLGLPLGPINDHPKITFIIGLSAVTLALMALHGGLFSARGRRPWLAAAPATVLLLGLVVAGYYADSRVEYTRYESMFHLPVEVVYGFAAIVACVAAARVLGDPERIAFSRRALVATALVAALGLSSIVYGAVAMDTSQTAKALFWGRSIVARRAFQAARWATDRDRDGFAATFGGADPDDADPARNPMAPEVPGNGVDENGIGGDLAASEFEPGALFGPPGGPTGAVQPAQVATAPRNVLIITIDCLRADHLSSYGYGKRTSPNIDRFAAEALLFERAYAQGTNTGHSLTSMFRSSYGDDIFDDRVPTFARLALEAGYRNEFLNAVRTDVWLNASRWDRYKTLMGDFEVAHEDGDRLLNAEALTDRAVEMLRAQDPAKPHMTWVHYFDCHQRRKKKPGHDFGRSPAGIFDSNVAYVDEHLERLFTYLRESGALDRTMVVISADHGEAFMEHGARDHNNKPYNNNTHVPLIVRAPGVAPGRVAEPCALVDVAPTVLAYMGIPTPSCYRGIDLVAAVREGGPPRRQIMCETPRNLIESSFYSWALVDWPHKILWDVRSNTVEVFDIEADPGERRNLADRDPALAARMRAALGAWLDRETARTRAVGPGDGDLDDTEQ